MEQAQQQKAIMDSPWMKCECGGMTFTQLIMVKRISGLLNGTGKDQVLEIPMMECNTCKKIPSFMHKMWPDMPDKMKASPKLKIK